MAIENKKDLLDTIEKQGKRIDELEKESKTRQGDLDSFLDFKKEKKKSEDT